MSMRDLQLALAHAHTLSLAPSVPSLLSGNVRIMDKNRKHEELNMVSGYHYIETVRPCQHQIRDSVARNRESFQ